MSFIDQLSFNSIVIIIAVLFFAFELIADFVRGKSRAMRAISKKQQELNTKTKIVQEKETELDIMLKDAQAKTDLINAKFADLKYREDHFDLHLR